jgi:Holliday junction resolvase RusA-like endonuclease
MSVNKCWQGRRFKTPAYKDYENAVLMLLPNILFKLDKVRLNLIFGLSNKGNDIDNGIKPFLDILQKKYGFNDSIIYELYVKKEIVKKGEEFIKFNMTNLKQKQDDKTIK